ncbi:MAG: hypothetical protein K6A72_00030 [Lachnospiraceae bacterium]|nr:hypothetical protein [Lachnospiraceae bacterium]
MKKIYKSCATIVYLIFVVLLTGCGEDTAAATRTAGQLTTVNDVLEAGMADEAESTAEPELSFEINTDEDKTEEAAPDKIEGETEQEETGDADTVADENIAVNEEEEKGVREVDIDLTVLSSTMVYSEVYNMMITPEDYVGKTIKMEGIYSVYYDEVSDKYYFACIIMDATACCSQGIEFMLGDDYRYPEDYPEEGSFICVEGVFDTYTEGENMYCTLRNAELDSWTSGSVEEVK